MEYTNLPAIQSCREANKGHEIIQGWWFSRINFLVVILHLFSSYWVSVCICITWTAAHQASSFFTHPPQACSMHVHWGWSDAINHLFPFVPIPASSSQHQCPFRVSNRVGKVQEVQLQHQFFQWILRLISLWLTGLISMHKNSQSLQHPQLESIEFFGAQRCLLLIEVYWLKKVKPYTSKASMLVKYLFSETIF